jgi:hypothetical protein
MDSTAFIRITQSGYVLPLNAVLAAPSDTSRIRIESDLHTKISRSFPARTNNAPSGCPLVFPRKARPGAIFGSYRFSARFRGFSGNIIHPYMMSPAPTYRQSNRFPEQHHKFPLVATNSVADAAAPRSARHESFGSLVLRYRVTG